MAILGIGTDIIEVARLEKAIARYGDKFLQRIFTHKEQAYCKKYKDAGRHFAGRFAAKEAAVKALGTGINRHVGWLDIEILNDVQGRPHLFFSERVLQLAGEVNVHLSLSHCRAYATACVLLES
jgi:holo-[acyl-carrier protein] synthase